MITFDGNRSKNRRTFAQRKLDQIKDMDLPAKNLLWDGFRIRVWQQGDLDGGRITAPMGAIVCMGSEDGIKNIVQVAVAEYFRGGFLPGQDVYCAYYPANGNNPRIKYFNYPDDDDFTADGNFLVKFEAFGSLSPFGLTGGVNPGPSTQWVRDFSGAPGVMPNRFNERAWLTLNDNVFIDLDNNGTADFPKYIYERTNVFYLWNGRNPEDPESGEKGYGLFNDKRGTVSLQVGGGSIMASADQPYRVIQHLSTEWQSMFHNPRYNAVGGQKVCVFNFHHPLNPNAATHPDDTIDLPAFIYLDDMVPAGAGGIPSALRDIILETTGTVSAWSIGSYTFGIVEDFPEEDRRELHQTVLHAVDLTNTNPWTSGSPSQAYFDSNSDQLHWKLFYAFKSGDVTSVIHSGQFRETLASLTQDTNILTSWNDTRRMLAQFFPAPNHNFTCPYDSIMFHGHDGNVYTWTRKYGAVKFTLSGLFTTPLAIPSEVLSEEGVRPEITHGGDGLYLCVCNKLKDKVAAVYVGSPFGSWEKLPGNPEPLIQGKPDPELVHVRPVRVTTDDIFLIGVIKDIVIENEEDVERYFFASLRRVIRDGVKSTDTWQRHGRLSFDVGENDNFSVGLYGNDPLVTALAEYPSPPPVLPKMPVGPYELYAIGQP